MDKYKSETLFDLCLRQRQRINRIQGLITALSDADQSIPLLVSSKAFKKLAVDLRECQQAVEVIKGLTADCANTSRLQLDVLEETIVVSTDLRYLNDLLPSAQTDVTSKPIWTWPWRTYSSGNMSRGLRAPISD